VVQIYEDVNKRKVWLQAMLDIAVNSKGDIVSVKSIAERQNISDHTWSRSFPY